MMRVDERLARHVSNRLAPVTDAIVTGIVGEAPSKYARTPRLWNAVYADLDWRAISVAWDVAPDRLAGFVGAIREAPEVAGFNVTNPHKIAILPLLDDVDPDARRIGAVNTVARSDGGHLVGYNTDGVGAVSALTMTLPGASSPLLSSLTGARVVILGAGGAARAAAFRCAAAAGPTGALRIVNRDIDRALALAAAVREAHGIGEGAGEHRLLDWIGDATLVINTTIKGQSGWWRTSGGAGYLLEPYSALGPAAPPSIALADAAGEEAAQAWYRLAAPDLARNLARAHEVLSAMPPAALCYDLIYSPLETRFLADARAAGHPTLNGKWMNVLQAVEAFAAVIFRQRLADAGLPAETGHERVLACMARAWA